MANNESNYLNRKADGIVSYLLHPEGGNEIVIRRIERLASDRQLEATRTPCTAPTFNLTNKRVLYAQ